MMYMYVYYNIAICCKEILFWKKKRSIGFGRSKITFSPSELHFRINQAQHLSCSQRGYGAHNEGRRKNVYIFVAMRNFRKTNTQKTCGHLFVIRMHKKSTRSGVIHVKFGPERNSLQFSNHPEWLRRTFFPPNCPPTGKIFTCAYSKNP